MKSFHVSIQLMSPASGDESIAQNEVIIKTHVVSIQLMSPASGDRAINRGRIHRTGFPFN